MILGIDEVGRGPWAGPLVVGAVVLGGAKIDGLTDSKKLSKKLRESLNQEIIQESAGYGLGWVDPAELDELGMGVALKLATTRAVKSVKTSYSEIIIDGTVNFLVDTPLGKYTKTMKKADLLIPSVSAASIIAKVARDEYMTRQAEVHPEYGFASNSGYGTLKHRQAVERYGVTPLHRLSFAPLRKYQKVSKIEAASINKIAKKVTTRSIGDVSESAACDELERLGHLIIERNWKTKYCEIDIISKKDQVIYFTEVKHRKSNTGGNGLDAITPKKLNQMRFAARMFLHIKKLKNYDARLLAIATSGVKPEVARVELVDL